MPDAPPPLLIALPHGLNVSGVTMWAVRLANALAAGTGAGAGSKTGWNGAGGVGLVVHREPSGHDRLPLALHPDVVVFDAGELPPIEEARGNL